MKIDLKRDIDGYRARRGSFDMVTVPPVRCLAIDGSGDPNTAPAYVDAVETIYPVAYKLKFHSKRVLDRDYVVMPLEALWWADDMAAFSSARDKSRWRWTLLNVLPDWITDEQFAAVAATVTDAPSLASLRLDRLDEGLCVQTLHIGSYDDEGPLLEQMHRRFIPDNSLRMTGRHHEIYLNDPRRTAPGKLRTILRQPVERI